MTRPPRRFGGPLRQRNFRLLWIGETVNQLGSAMALIGVPLLAVVFLHATSFEVGVLTAAVYLPWLVIGLPAGAWVDRLPSRPVMIACDVISAALYASVPIAYAAHVLTVGQLMAVQLLAGAVSVLFTTAYQVAGTVGSLPAALLVPLTGPGPGLAFFVVGVLVAGAGVGTFNVILATFRQAYCPRAMIGRVTATMRFLSQGTGPAGAFAGGVLGTWLHPRNALWVMMVILAGCGTLLLTPAFIRRRDLPAAAVAEPAGAST